ncbi:MAG TPA: hypothetical protein VNG13_08250 [Mycobacteriales bacterium]|nr:hypothetical protein [Mycobacteriales bacterium]
MTAEQAGQLLGRPGWAACRERADAGRRWMSWFALENCGTPRRPPSQRSLGFCPEHIWWLQTSGQAPKPLPYAHQPIVPAALDALDGPAVPGSSLPRVFVCERGHRHRPDPGPATR